MESLSRRHLLKVAGISTTAMALGVLCGCTKREQSQVQLSNVRFQAPWINDAEFIGYFIGIYKQFYQEQGIRLDYMSGGPDKISGEVLASGACDIALTNIDGTATAIHSQGAKFKIVGAQYQKSPLGIVSLRQNNINQPSDLVGKKLAVPSANKSTVKEFLAINNIDHRDVEFIPYQYDPRILVLGSADATVDFVTNVPYSIRKRNQEPTSFLFYDYGFKQFMDTVVVREDYLKSNREDVKAFLRASRIGWQENFKNVYKYPKEFAKTFFKGTGRDIDNEIYFNEQQQPLMESEAGFFAMSDVDIEDNLVALNRIGIPVDESIFDTSLLRELDAE